MSRAVTEAKSREDLNLKPLAKSANQGNAEDTPSLKSKRQPTTFSAARRAVAEQLALET